MLVDSHNIPLSTNKIVSYFFTISIISINNFYNFRFNIECNFEVSTESR